jgi:hypothetical protein
VAAAAISVGFNVLVLLLVVLLVLLGLAGVDCS